MHFRVATVHAPPDDAVAAVAAVGPEDADLVEVRLDAAWHGPPEPDAASEWLERLLEAAQVPLVATLRPVRQGGTFAGPEEVRVGLLEAAARSGFAWIDLENDLAAMAPILRHLSKATRRIVLSNHLDAIPERDLGSRHLTAMQDLGARLQKLAFPAGTGPAALIATLRALELVRLHGGRGGAPAVAPVGNDAATRALLAVVGNQATYGATGGAGAPGQPPLADIEAVWRHWGIDRGDLGVVRPWYAVLGDPVAHSLSPRMHNAAGLGEARCAALHVPQARGMLQLVVAVANRIGLAGASITAPWKQEALHVATPDELARSVGAANCLYWEDGARCTNTDATAFLRILDKAAAVRVLGAGGAARAAAWAAGELGLPLEVSARNPTAATAVAKAFGGTVRPWDARTNDAEDATVVQCTPADVWDDTEPAGAVELVYDRSTRLAAATAPERLVDGRAFLVEQGIDARRAWGAAADREAMRAALGL